MKSRHWGTLLGMLAFASLGFSAGCGEDAADPPATGGTAGTAGSSGSAGAAGAAVVNDCDDEASCKEKYGTKPGEGAEPPAAPADAPAAGEDLVHALSKLYVGETDRGGNVSIDAWKDIGFDIDGWTSTAKQGFHCKPASGAKAADIRVDGNKGIDNSFGKNIVNGILATLISNPSDEISSSITEGSFSIVLKMEKIGTAASATAIKTQLFAAKGAEADGKDVPPPASGDWSGYAWRPFPEIVNEDGSSKVQFANSYINSNTWVSGGKGVVKLQLAIQGFNLALDINQAQLAVDLTDRKSGTNGTIGGVLATEQLVDALKKVAGNFGSNFCGESSALDGILESVRQASDILQDGSQDPTKDCNGISIGLGFDSKASSLGEKAPVSEPSDPCAAP
jgi:hypothetical protein